MNMELEFQIRQAHYQNLLKEAEQHRLLSKAKNSRKERKSFTAAKRKSERLGRAKTWRQALGTS